MEKKEAMKILKDFHDKSALFSVRTALDTIFPELKESEDERVKKELIELISCMHDADPRKKGWIAWLEKQNKHQQLYIRFGNIPSNEKSKIYRGEEEIGTENGMSVYPAFKTDEGDIVLGLSLPITKTTLYTQQHLIEYDDRPCYLVKGNYVGKDTDGQPLINNVSIIKKIDNYRVKEEKQGEQKPADKVEPKFHEGEWVIDNNGKVAIIYDLQKAGYVGHYTNGTDFVCKYDNEHLLHLWTINDATEGDVLIASDNSVFIYAGSADRYAKFYAALTKYSALNLEGGNWEDKNRVHPATKEQRDTLEKVMAEEGYTFDFEKKELKKIDTLLDLLRKMPSCITVDGIFYHFVLRKTALAYTAYYAGEEEGEGKVIFVMTAFSPIDLLTDMLEELKEKGLLE